MVTMVNMRLPDEKLKRVFFYEDSGPPEVSAAEMAFLDKQAMYAELEHLRKLAVICDVLDGLDVTRALHLDTRLVRDWRFRQGAWIRRGWLQGSSKDSVLQQKKLSVLQPFLMMVKVLMVMSLVKGLLMSVLWMPAMLVFKSCNVKML